MREIKVIDFVPYPGGRLIVSGPYSGEWFRETILLPRFREALAEGDALTVVLDGAPGYGVSFLEEAFGGLVRWHGFTRQQMKSLLVISKTTFFKTFERLANRYIENALESAPRKGSVVSA